MRSWPSRLGEPLPGALVSGAVAASLYLTLAGHWPLWDAELWTANAASGSLAHLVDTVSANRHPPLYFALVWCVARVSASDAALRLVSALAAAMAVGLTHHVAARRLGAGWGWCAALLLGLSPFSVSHALNARAGALTIALSAWMISAALGVRAGRRGAPVELGVAATLGLYTHYSVVLAWAGCLAGLWLGGATPERWQRARRGAVALGVALVAFLPWLALVTTHQGLVGSGGATPLAARLMFVQFALWPLGPGFVPGASYVVLVLAAIGAVVAVLRPAWRGWLLAWLVVGLAVPWAWNGDPAIGARSYLYAPLLPGFVLLAALGVRRLVPWPALAVAGCALVWLPSAVLLTRLASNPVSIWPPDSQGVYDFRLEARALGAMERSHTVPLGEAKALGHWRRQDPDLASRRARRATWAVAPRHGHGGVQAEPWEDEALPGCAFREAFSARVVVLDRGDCRALRAAIDHLAERTGHGPFLLESARTALDRGERDQAGDLAARAARASPASARPEQLLVELWIGEDPGAALMWADRGLAKSLRFHRMDAALELARTREKILDDVPTLDEGGRRGTARCLERRRDRPWAVACGW